MRGDGLPDGVLLVPLGGHTPGHQGVAVRTAAGWLLHVGDLWAHRGHLHGTPVPWGIRAFEWAIADDRHTLRANQARVRQLAAGSADVRVICAHDADDFRAAGLATAASTA